MHRSSKPIPLTSLLTLHRRDTATASRRRSSPQIYASALLNQVGLARALKEREPRTFRPALPGLWPAQENLVGQNRVVNFGD